MSKIGKIILVAIFGIAVLCAGGVKKAEALMMLSVSDGTSTIVYSDNVASGSLSGPAVVGSDGDSGFFGTYLGIMETSTLFAVSGFIPTQFTSTIDQSKPVIGSAVFPIMDLSGVATGAGTFTLKLTDTDFGPTSPANFPGFGLAVGGTHPAGGSWSMTVDYFADTSNTPFGEGTTLGSLSPTLGAFGQYSAGAVSPPFTGDLYSLTMKLVITQTGGTTTFNAHTAPVPEPGTIALLGIGLAGLVGVGVRRKMKKNVA